ncbi:hypothetical protein BY458DRAFT_486611 [Sporodiniella umbellata]|nr:hypothetical protein BY458DRAFT_486611 [Sporodiniella umbellata]
MGLSQSKAQQEPVIFINPNVPVQFTSSFINTLEKNVEKAPEALKSRQVEALVQIRVNEELEKMKLAESEISSTLATKEPPTIKTNHDLDATLKKIQRVNAKEVPAIIKEQQDKLVACYK